MVRVVCVDATNSMALVVDQIYFAFPVNELKTAAYVSNFNRESAHFGCFQMNRFKVLESSFEQLRWF